MLGASRISEKRRGASCALAPAMLSRRARPQRRGRARLSPTVARELDLSAGSINAFLAATVEPGNGDVVVDDVASEARLACRLIAGVGPTSDTRILEVGAGAGIVAAFLHQQGANVVAIEPQ